MAVGFAVAGLAYAGGLFTFDPRASAAAVPATPATAGPARTGSALSPDHADAGTAMTSTDVLRAALDVRGTAPGPYAVALSITNTGRKLAELRFASGHTHDMALRDAAGKEVWRWSEGRMFTQAMRTRSLDGGATVEYVEVLPTTLAAGTYTVVAVLKSENHPVELTRGFVVP
jgi:hypothetical protein